MESMLQRRSRRFARGLSLSGGPLAYDSYLDPQPLTVEEEAVLAFAGCGITGPALAELPFQDGGKSETGGGNIMVNLTHLCRYRIKYFVFTSRWDFFKPSMALQILNFILQSS